MFRLTREVRFAANQADDPQLAGQPTNGYAGFPSLTGFGPYLSLHVTLSGPLNPVSSYLINIKQIDSCVREIAIPLVTRAVHGANTTSPARLIGELYQRLQSWKPLVLEELRLDLSPFLSVST